MSAIANKQGANENTDYEVGYGKPPKNTRFKPGQSGNAKGRTKGAKSLRSHVQKLLDQKILISDSGGQRKISTREAMAKRLMEKALAGDLKSIQILLSLDMDRSDTRDQLFTDTLTEAEQKQLNQFMLEHSSLEQDTND